MILLGLLSCLAILICNLPLLVQIILCGAIIALAFYKHKSINGVVCLTHYAGPDDSGTQWAIGKPDSQKLEGQLIASGYRSAALLILAIRCDNDSRTRRIPVWVDSVDAMKFSYLNLQIMFNTARS